MHLADGVGTRASVFRRRDRWRAGATDNAEGPRPLLRTFLARLRQSASYVTRVPRCRAAFRESDSQFRDSKSLKIAPLPVRSLGFPSTLLRMTLALRTAPRPARSPATAPRLFTSLSPGAACLTSRWRLAERFRVSSRRVRLSGVYGSSPNPHIRECIGPSCERRFATVYAPPPRVYNLGWRGVPPPPQGAPRQLFRP